jgi:hypothetical protein
MATDRIDLETGATDRVNPQTGTAPGLRTRGYESRRTFTETKAGFKTTEFMVALAAMVAILIATYVADADLGANDGWKYIAWVAVAYIVSRGLAKLGTREPYSERAETNGLRGD